MAKSFLSTTQFNVTIDKAALLQSISAGPNGKITGVQVRKYVTPIIEEAKQELIRDFYSHIITKEIQAGPSGSNSSGTLGGYGNLFAFIGFDSGDRPLANIESVLRRRLTTTVRAVGNGRFNIKILNAPSEQDIYAVTPIPWADGASWAESMEKGMSNLGSFLYKSSGLSGSNSGTGIQTKKQFRATNFRTTPYISELIDKFLTNITKF